MNQRGQVVDRQAGCGADTLSVWRHVGALKDDGVDVRMARKEHVGGRLVLLGGPLDIELCSIAENLPGKIAADLVQPLHRHPRLVGDAGRRQMSLAQ
jgi:hypothetical protein